MFCINVNTNSHISDEGQLMIASTEDAHFDYESQIKELELTVKKLRRSLEALRIEKEEHIATLIMGHEGEMDNLKNTIIELRKKLDAK